MRSDSVSGVFYDNFRIRPSSFLSILQPQSDISLCCVFHRISQKVVQNRSHDLRIEIHTAFFRRDFYSEIHLRITVQFFVTEPHFHYQLTQPPFCHFEPTVSGFNFTEIQ